MLGLLSYDEIGFDLHSLDWLVSTRFLLITLLSGLVTESLDWLVWRDCLTWHERLGLMSFCACAAFLVVTWLGMVMFGQAVRSKMVESILLT